MPSYIEYYFYEDLSTPHVWYIILYLCVNSGIKPTWMNYQQLQPGNDFTKLSSMSKGRTFFAIHYVRFLIKSAKAEVNRI